MYPLLSTVKKMYSRSCRIIKMANTRYLSASFENNPYDLHNLDKGPSTNIELNKEDALLYLKQMLTIRKMETAAANLYKEKKILGFCHLYSGQEACAVGLKAVMRPQDTVITSYRCHSWALLMDGTVESVISELLAKRSGISRGKGGSMHMYGKNFYGGNGIVGSHVPLGTGLAFAHKYKKTDAISVTLYGDGASNQGQLFEAFNIAKLQSLPVLYVIENNTYAMGTSTARGAANTLLYKRGDYIPGIRLDGMDILAVRQSTKFAFEYIHSGNGPIILELDTYRYYGHSMSDPGTSYRTRDEIKEVREQRDPINLFKQKITSAGLATEDEIKKLDGDIKKEVDAAVKKALDEKTPDVQEAFCDVYVTYKEKIRTPSMNKFVEHKNVGFKPTNI